MPRHRAEDRLVGRTPPKDGILQTFDACRRECGEQRLDHGKARGHHRSRFDTETFDLGNEPPLSVDGGTGGVIDRRRVSAQWFSGTILTGVCGAALMGGAVFASLDGETNFAAVPERLDSLMRGAISAVGEKLAARKGDRLPPAGEANAARHLIRDTRPVRVGEREIMQVKTFVRVAANLAMSTSELSANVPPFNPQKLLSADAGGTPMDEQPGAVPDAEVSYVTRDLAGVLPRAKIAATIPIDDVLARVRDTANWSGTGGPQAARYQVASVPPGGAALAYATDGTSDPYAGFEARIVPENITLLPKTTAQITGGNAWNERSVSVKKGDTVASILRELGASPEEIRAITAALGARGRDNGIREGQKLRILLAPVGAASHMQPYRVIVTGDSGVEAVAAISDSGKYVPVDVSALNEASAAAADNTEDEEDDGSGVRLYQSLYESALRNQVPRPIIESLVRIYSYDVDFQHKTQPGDSFDVVYSGDEDGSADAKGDVLFASLTVGGETKKFYRFQTSDDNLVDYYDETGKSAKKFLVRKPVPIGIVRSGFGVRNHPLLGIAKMHTGVDWAAPLGTPIYASGNGTVEKAGWESGYGKYVRIHHANGYETAYGHMTAFARSTQPGARVRQGQVIGYVGSTGQSTGPHVHYEILVNGRFVDPLRVKLPRGRVLEGQLLAGFERARDKLDGIIARPAARVAQAAAAQNR
jgi:murein DD-endopeptidase MepM/ murein hydrolase activator NlpD